MTIERLEPRLGAGPHMSSTVVHNDTIYLAGQVAKDPQPDIQDQTRQILENIERQTGGGWQQQIENPVHPDLDH